MSSWNGRISVPVSTVAMPTSRSVEPSIVEGRRITASAANFVEAVALRRRGERSNHDPRRRLAASQSVFTTSVQMHTGQRGVAPDSTAPSVAMTEALIQSFPN
jgi:hypothetical protein